MSIDAIKEKLPEYAKDLKLNLSNITRSEALTPKQQWGSMLACALASTCGELAKAVLADASSHLSDTDIVAVKGAAAIMSMNNVYYRFAHVIGDPEIEKMPARLRMNFIANPGCDKVDFECWSLAVSILNNCQKCIQAHAGQLAHAGVSKNALQEIGRIAAVTKAVAEILKWEASLATH